MSSVERSTEIGLDADQWSLSRSASNSQSAIGLGTVSGRAILAVGELALRGIEMVNIIVTLQRISSHIRDTRTSNEALLPQDLQDLLELQRIGLYPRFIRRKAWVSLYALLEQDRVNDIVSTLLSWTALEVQLFLRQLVSYHSTAWASLIRDLPECPDSDSVARVADSICHILIALLQHDSFVVYEIYDVYKFARLLSPRPDTGQSRRTHKTRDSLTRFFGRWIQHVAVNGQDEKLLSATCLVTYLSKGSQSQIQVVVSHILSAVSPFAYLPDDGENDPISHMRKRVKEVLKRYPSLNQGHGTFLRHPTLPFLLFIQLLSHESQMAVELFASNGLVDILKRLHAIRYFNGTDQSTRTIRYMDAVCQSVLHILDPDMTLPSLSHIPPLHTYPSQSTSKPPSPSTSATLRKQSSSDSASSLRAVFRLKMPPPPPPPSPTLPCAPPPSPNVSLYNLSLASDEALSTSIGLDIRPPSGEISLASSTFTDETEDLTSTPPSDQLLFSLESSPSTFYANLSRTDCATLGVKSLSSRYPSRQSTMHTLRSTSRFTHSISLSISDIPAQAGDPSSGSFLNWIDPQINMHSLLSSQLLLSPTASSFRSDRLSAETLNGHVPFPEVEAEDGYEIVCLDSESYFVEFGSAVNHDASVHAWFSESGLKDSRAKRIVRRLVDALRTLKTKDRRPAGG